MRSEFIKALLLLAEICEKELSKELINLYDKMLKHLGYPELQNAILGMIENRLSRDRFPSVKEIRILLSPEMDKLAEANEAAARIIGAISMFGYMNVSGAKKYIGELGWSVVQKNGGWELLCQSTMTDQIGTMRAQFRDIAKSTLIRNDYGMLDMPPEIPKVENKNRLKILTNSMNKELPYDEKRKEQNDR